MIRVAFGPQIFGLQVYGGVSRYFCQLTEQLAQCSGIQPRIIAPLHINAYLRALDPRLVVGKAVPRIPGAGRILQELNILLFRAVARRVQPAIVHETYFSPRPCQYAGVPRVLTVYDMIHERFPAHFSASDRIAEFKRAAILRADHVFCISENTRKDLQEIYRLPDERVSVTQLGHAMPAGTRVAGMKLAGSAPFLLYVGERRGYKNFSAFIAAFANSPWLRNNIRIVCFGGGQFRTGELEMMTQLGLGEDLLQQISGSDADLANLYCSATALVYPSRYEGFGIPLLEAMSLGCPVVCSNSSSIPEVVANAGEYFAPGDRDSIQDALERVLQSSSRQVELADLGHVRCRHFSWSRCATETHSVYKKLLAQSG